MGSWDAGSVESNRSGKLAPSLTELALLCWDQVGTVPRAQRAFPAVLPPASPTAWARPENSAQRHPCPALGSGRHQTMWPGGLGGWETGRGTSLRASPRHSAAGRAAQGAYSRSWAGARLFLLLLLLPRTGPPSGAGNSVLVSPSWVPCRPCLEGDAGRVEALQKH